MVLCGLATTLVSPYSWVHHWVWLGALLVWLLDASLRPRAFGAWLALLVTAFVVSGGVLDLLGADVGTVLDFPDWHGLEIVYQNAYIWLTVLAFAVVAVRLKKLTASREKESSSSARS